MSARSEVELAYARDAMNDFGTTYSFLSLLEVHAQLDDLFLLHQEALLRLDIEKAGQLLERYELALHAHMRDEDEYLLPRYAAGGAAPRASAELFEAEHDRIKHFVSKFRVRVQQLAADPTPRGVIALITDQALFKGLMEHHDIREKELLYPTLDRLIATDEEREQLLTKFLDVENR